MSFKYVDNIIFFEFELLFVFKLKKLLVLFLLENEVEEISSFKLFL